MMSIWVVFWMLVVIFSVVGAFRGWVKELLVIFSVILALFLLHIAGKYFGVVQPFADVLDGVDSELAFSGLAETTQKALQIQFWVRALIILALAAFGYQTPNVSFIKDKARREHIQDILFGAVLGAINGYLIIGSLWAYMDSAHYLFDAYVSRPAVGTELGDKALALINNLPPNFFSSEAGLLMAVGVSFLFVLVVFI